MKTRLTLCTALFAFLISLAAHAQTPPPTAAPVTLRLKYTPGEVLHYKMTMDMDMTTTMNGQAANSAAAIPPMKQHMETAMDQTVQSVNPADGSATLLEHITQMTSTMNGQPVPGMDALTNAYKDGFTMIMSPSGKILSFKMPPPIAGKLPPGMDLSKIGGMAATMLPAGPVRAGDTWGSDTDLSPMLGQLPGAAGMKMTILSTLAGIETGAQPIADINQTYNGTINTSTPIPNAGSLRITGRLGGTTQVQFDINDGSMTSQDGTMTMNMITRLPKNPPSSTAPPQIMKMQMQMTTHLTRLPVTLK
jgi:hypothetical protein